MKVADVKLFWTKSPSADVVFQRLEVAVDGSLRSSVEFGPEVQETMIEVKASETVVFNVSTIDVEGNETVSASYTITLGDLEAPFPATGLGHAIVAVRTVDEEVPA